MPLWLQAELQKEPLERWEWIIKEGTLGRNQREGTKGKEHNMNYRQGLESKSARKINLEIEYFERTLDSGSRKELWWERAGLKRWKL